MHNKFLNTLLIIVLILGVAPMAWAQPSAATESQAPSVAAPQPPGPSAVSSRMRELTAEELAGLQSPDLGLDGGRAVPRALSGQAKAGQKTMLVVELKGAPLAAHAAQQKSAGKLLTADNLQAYLQGLETAQATVQTQLEALGVQVVSNYTTVYNGFLAYVPQDQVDTILKLSEVVGVHRAPQHVPALGSSVPLIRAPEVWNDLGYDGTDVVVAIIDTGIDYTHAVFGGSGDPNDYADNDPDVVEPGTFPTAKVIEGWDFAGTDRKSVV